MKIRNRMPLVLLTGTLLASALLFPKEAAARDEFARVDINGGSARNPVGFEITETAPSGKVVTNPSDNGVDSVSIMLPASNSWTQGTITLMPNSTGMIGITLLGPHILVDPETRELRPFFIEYDDVKSETAPLKNGSFEKSSSKEPVADWKIQNIPESNPPIDASNQGGPVDGDSSEGDRHLRVWHNSRATQLFFVEAGTPVAITFMFRVGQ